MNTDMKLLPHTGVKQAIFFNRMHAINLERAIARDIPGQLTIYRGRTDMEAALREAGLDVAIPETVPFRQPVSVYGKQADAPDIAMVITDLNQNRFLQLATEIGDDAAGEFRSQSDRVRKYDYTADPDVI